jgi:cytochrome P450
VNAAESVGLLLTPEGRFDPYPTYEQIRSYGPIGLVGEGFYVTTSYEIIDDLLRDSRTRVSDRELLKRMLPDWQPAGAAGSILDSMLQTNGDDHTRMRRLASGAFTARRVAAMEQTVAELAQRLATELAAADGPVDFMDAFAYPLPIQVICAMLGVPGDDQDWFKTQAAELTVVIEPALRLEDLTEADNAALNLGGYFAEMVERRRAEPRDDLTTALVQAADSEGGRLSNDELLANLILLLVAGFETTTNLLGNGIRILLDHPELADRLRAEPQHAPAYVSEILRYDSPVQLTSRWSREDVTVAGTTVEPYAQILMLLGGGNRDPQRFADPTVFNPFRDGNQPLSFGGGAHYCLGAPLARLEAQVALPLLLARFPGLALAGEPVRRNRLTLRGYASLPVTVTAA